jgi:MscS family membrane protein
LIRNLSTLFVFAMGGIMVLKHFGYDVMSLLAALGVGSLAVGLAAKEAISNMISGFVLIMDRNLRHGDRILLGGVTGDVEQIGLRSTRIRTGEGNTMIVPNFDLVNNRIVNLSDPSRASTCSTQIRVPYSASFEQVRQIAVGILRSIPQVNSAKDPWVNLSSLADGSQLITIGCWLREMDDSGAVLTALHQQLLASLKAAGISLIEPAQLLAQK